MIKFDKKQPTEYVIKYSFKKPTFGAMDIKGAVIDEILETREFNITSIAEGPFESIIFEKRTHPNSPDYVKLLEITKEYVRFSSFVGESFPVSSAENIKFILGKIGNPEYRTFGVAINQGFYLSEDNLNILCEKFFKSNNWNLMPEKNDDDIKFNSVYRTTYTVDKAQIHLALDIMHKDSSNMNRPNVLLFLDYVSLAGPEFNDKQIKKKLDYLIDLTKKIGFEI